MTDLARPIVRSPKRAEAWAKKALARISGLTPILAAEAYAVVLRPGGTAGPGVFTSWAALYPAMSVVSRPVKVQVDSALAAAHMTAGGPYVLDGWIFVAARGPGSGPSGRSVLNIDAGVTLAPGTLIIDEGLAVECNATATVMTAAPGRCPLIVVAHGSILACNAAGGVFLEVGAGAQASVVLETGSTLGDGVHPALLADGGATALNVSAYSSSTLAAAAFATSSALVLQYDASVVNNLGIVLTEAAVLADSSAQVVYVPSASGNWSPVPSDVKAALDQLASRTTAKGLYVNIAAAPFNVDNTGATNAAPAIMTALAALVTTGQIAWFPDGTYLITSPITLPSLSKIRLSSGVVITSTMASTGAGGNTNNVFLATGTPLTDQTTLASTPVVGSETFALTSTVGYSIGAPILVHSAIDAYYAAYIIENIAGANVTVDRPILKPFIGGDIVQLMAQMPQGIEIIADRGAILSGTGDRGFELEYGRDHVVSGLTINSSFSSYGLASRFNQRTLVQDCILNFVANTPNGMVNEGDEYSHNSRVTVEGGFTTYGMGYESTEWQSEDNCTTNGCGQYGLDLYAAGADPYGPRHTTIKGHGSTQCGAAGILVLFAQDTNLIGCQTPSNTAFGIKVQNTVTGSVRIVGGNGGGNGTYDLALGADTEVDGFSSLPQSFGGFSAGDGISEICVYVSNAANVTCSGLKLNGNGAGAAAWYGVYNGASGRVTVTASDIRANGSGSVGIANEGSGQTFADSTTIVTHTGLVIGGNTTDTFIAGPTLDLTGSTIPKTASPWMVNFGTLTLNGTTQVAVPGAWLKGAAISLSLKTVGSTPGTGAPYFSTAQSPVTQGSAASIAFAANVNTFTGLAGITASMVGLPFIVSGSAHAGNNGNFTILAVLSATSVTVTNTGGATDVSGAVSWYVPQAFYITSPTAAANDVYDWFAIGGVA